MDFAKIEQVYKKVSYTRKPDTLTLEEWQYALRRQFASTHPFKIRKAGRGIVFGDYLVANPETGNNYKVALRSADNSYNFCECNDFKTNGLGTCKHIEAVFFQIHQQQKIHLLTNNNTLPYSSVYLDYRNERKVTLRIGTEDRADYQQLASEYFDRNLCLKESSVAKFDVFLSVAEAINQSFRCYPDVLAFVLEQRETQKRATLIDEKYKTGDYQAIETLVKAKLFPYQKEGIYFAARKGRCIIADDMGLGKTLQAIAAAELLRNEGFIASVVIICPTSLKYQWKTEIEKFTQQSAFVVEGSPLKRQEQYQDGSFYKIVSYHTAVNDIKYIHAAFPDLVILDEAQRIKNFKAKISRTIKKIQSPLAFVLTGTPLENKLEELYSIVQFIDPFVLGPFYKFLEDHRLTDERGKITGYTELHRIGEKLADTMIRRCKKDVLLQLPERMDKVLLVPMTQAQSDIHEEYKYSVSLLVHKWQKQGFLNEKDRQRLMIFLNMMRMVCDSTYILDQKTRHDTKIEELMNILDEVFAEGDEKVVVFSQWERMTRIVANELDERGIGYEYLHGGVPGSERGKLYDGFNNNPECRVFLSTDAGGVGLNLQAGSLLINLDIPWNPAVLEQRIGRIYRLGQKRNVSIINMVSAGTIEHRMLGVLNFKKGLASGILDQGESTIFLPAGQFKSFMSSVEKMIGEPQSQPVHAEADSQDELAEVAAINPDETPKDEVTAEASPSRKETPEVPEEPKATFAGDDDVIPVQTPVAASSSNETQPEQLLQMGLSFLGSLGKTLSSPEATQRLIQSVVQKDEKDGRTYLKIPVESEKVVENVISLFAGLMNSLKK